jgi:probable rRNA maturation factor
MLDVEIQQACAWPRVPADADFQRWATAAAKTSRGELVIRIVEREESADLNDRYRGKAGPTNVLSFPFQVPNGVPCDLLGDLIICAPLVQEEAESQGKLPDAHWAHLTVHGVLHLLGFDHRSEAEAAIMEAEEIAILRQLGYPNPYDDSATS